MAVTQIRGSTQILDGSIYNAQINAAAAIATSKLADGANLAFLDGSRPLTADWALGDFKLTGLATPTADTHAATKGYVDAVKTGLDFKDSTRVATTAALASYTYSSNVLTATANGALSVDSVSVSANDRVLVKDESGANEKYNGIYYVSAVGSGAAPWTLTRATDADSDAEVTGGLFCFVNQGTTNSDTGWVLSTNDAITLNTTALTFVQFSAAGQVIAGAGLTRSGLTLDVVSANGGIVVGADAITLTVSGATLEVVAGGIRVAAGGITSNELAADSVTTAKIVDGNVTAGKLASDSVTTVKILDSNVTTAKINDSAVTAAKIASDAVTTIKILDSNVTTAKINDSAVTAGKIASDAVTTIKILDANVTTAKIADSNVTTAKINDLAVTSGKLAADSVLTAKILDANVTTAKIADSNVTAAKLASDSVTTIKILDANVTTAKIADSNVTTAKINDLAVTAGKLASDSVTTAKILDANVTTAKILDSNVTTAKIADANVTSAKLAAAVAGDGIAGGAGTALSVDWQNTTASGDGAEDTFAAGGTPVLSSLMVFQNGMLMEGSGNDYTLTGTDVVFVTAPANGDKLRFCFLK